MKNKATDTDTDRDKNKDKDKDDKDNGTDPLPQDVVRALLDAFDPGNVAAPPAGLKARVIQAIREPELPGVVTVRAGEGTWIPLGDGVHSKTLYDDGLRMTWLARMQPGARLPAHEHLDDEECLVLEGSIVLNQETLRPGDYQMAEGGTSHSEAWTETGCLLLLRSRSCPMGPSPA